MADGQRTKVASRAEIEKFQKLKIFFNAETRFQYLIYECFGDQTKQ